MKYEAVLGLASYATLVNSGNSRYEGSGFRGEGRFFLSLQPESVLESYSLSQSGTIPEGAQFIMFKGMGNWNVSFNGQSLVGGCIIDRQDLRRFYVSPFGGQTGVLRIDPDRVGGLGTSLDSFEFIIPEPSIMSLAVFCGGFFLLMARCRKVLSRG